MIRRSAPAVAVLAVVTLATATPATASQPSYPDVALIAGPVVVEGDAKVRSEHVRIDCREADVNGGCVVEATYVLTGGGGVALVALAHAAEGATITVDRGSVAAAGELSQETLDRVDVLDSGEGKDAASWIAGRFRHSNTPEISRVTVTAGAEPATISVKAVLEPPSRRGGDGLSAVATRHLILGDSGAEQDRALDVVTSALRSRARDYQLIVELERPDTWYLTTHHLSGELADRMETATETRLRPSKRQGRTVMRLASAGAESPRLGLVLTEPGELFHRGGPIIGAGVRLGEGFEMRLGWEVAAPDWVLYTLNLESDFQETFRIAPVVQFASPANPGIPMAFIFGIGGTLDVAPKVEGAVRMQATFQMFIVGLSMAADIYVARDPIGAKISLMGELTF